MTEPLKAGDWVYVKRHPFIAGRTAKVTKVEGDGVKPCPCCGMGVSLTLGDPNDSFGAAPTDLDRLDRPPV